MLVEKPVRADSRSELMRYLCEIHNVVNERTGKPQFPCQYVEDIWGVSPSTGSGSDCGCTRKSFFDSFKNPPTSANGL